MSPTLISIIAIAVAITVPALVAMATHNRLVALDQRCGTAFADVDVHLKHRQNLIPGLVEVVRGFAGHEHDVLIGLARARAEALAAVAPDARMAAENAVTRNVNALIRVAQGHPDLRASGHFAALRDELVGAENRITAARRFYNLAVGEYASTLRQFPGSLVARRGGFDPRKPFDLGLERVLIDEPAAIRF